MNLPILNPNVAEGSGLGERRLWKYIKKIAGYTAVAGGLFYACARLLLSAFYSQFSITPEDAGCSV